MAEGLATVEELATLEGGHGRRRTARCLNRAERRTATPKAVPHAKRRVTINNRVSARESRRRALLSCAAGRSMLWAR